MCLKFISFKEKITFFFWIYLFSLPTNYHLRGKGWPALYTVRHPITTGTKCRFLVPARNQLVQQDPSTVWIFRGQGEVQILLYRYCIVWSFGWILMLRGKWVPKVSSLLGEGFECEQYQNLQLWHIGVILGQTQKSSESCSWIYPFVPLLQLIQGVTRKACTHYECCLFLVNLIFSFSSF